MTVVVGAIFIKETRDHQIDTAIRKNTSVQEIFDWVAVLAALAIGFVLLLQWYSDFLPDLAAGKGFFAAFWNNVWYPLMGAMALWALPTLFFRLEFDRLRALGMVLACQALTALFSLKLYQSLGGPGRTVAVLRLHPGHLAIYTAGAGGGLRLRPETAGIRLTPAAVR